MTTKTGEKLRGRKRDPEVLAKAWATRRRKKRLAARQGEATIRITAAPKKRRKRQPKTKGGLMTAGALVGHLGASLPQAKRRGSKKPTRKRSAREQVLMVSGQSNWTPRGPRHSKKPIVTDLSIDTVFANAATPSQATETASSLNQAFYGDAAIPADGNMAHKASDLMTLARKRGGKTEVEKYLGDLVYRAIQQGMTKASAAYRSETSNTIRQIDNRIVCGFLAEVREQETLHRGLPPSMVFTLNAYTIVKIVEALNRAGFTTVRAPGQDGRLI